MGPRRSESVPRDRLFRNRLENLIDQCHELVRLGKVVLFESHVDAPTAHG